MKILLIIFLIELVITLILTIIEEILKIKYKKFKNKIMEEMKKWQ